MAKNNYYLISRETAKYWKKAIKNDRVMIANHDGNIYIINGYNAFRFPAAPLYWDEIARPAFMCDMPSENAASTWWNGEKKPGIAAEIANIFDCNSKNIATAAERTPFTMEHKSMALQLFKNGHGDITTVNAAYDALVNWEYAKEIYCNGKVSLVCVSDNCGFTALLMPVRRPDNMEYIVNETFAAFIGGGTK